MNTKTDGISSGLVAVAWLAPSNYEWPSHFFSMTEIRNGEPLVRLSDAEAIILDLQNLVTAENQRKQQFEAEVAAKDAEIERLERESSACDLIEEQKGTITALNMALGGEDSTSTENLIDAYEVDYNEEGLISLCRKLIAENVRLGDKLESTGYSPITEEIEDILRSENQILKSQNQMLIERVDSWTRDAQTLSSQIEEYRQDTQTTADALGHIQQQFELANKDRDDWIACHAKVFRELQGTKSIIEKQSAALKLAREALFDMQDSYAAVHGWKDSFVIAATTAIAAIDALGEVK